MSSLHIPRNVRVLDRSLVEASSAVRPSALDPIMVRLTGLADHGVVWLIAGGVLAASGGSRRRAAVRGLLSVSAASGVANAVLKPVMPRDRPPSLAVPEVRRIVKPPVSSSFPSGHAASAAAFVTGVALESPVAAAVVAPLAVAVAYSRVHVGVHWPSDVVVGAVVGAAVALSTRRWWAVRSDDPAELSGAGRAPALPGGTGMVVLVNPGAGSKDSEVADAIARALPGATVFEPSPDRGFGEQLTEQVTADVRAIGVCGGDGTVGAAVAVAINKGLPLAVFPGGTLNHFARDTDSTDVESVARGIEEGNAAAVDVGPVPIDRGSCPGFVNTSSIGGYPDSVLLRDKWSSRVGKWPAAAAAMVKVLAVARPLVVDIDGQRESVWMLFVGNGHYSPSDQVPMSRKSLAGGTLDVRFLRSSVPLSRTRLLFAAATGTLGASATYVQRRMASVAVRAMGPSVAVAVDGEVAGEGRAFDFDARPSAMTLYQPEPNDPGNSLGA